MAIAMFSLTGIPLTAGFWGKLLVFGSAVRVGWEWLALLALVGSVISFGYYGSVLKALFFEEGSGGASADDDPMTARPALIVTALLAFLILAIGVAPLFYGAGILRNLFLF